MTMLSPRRSTVFTRPRSSIGADHGGHWKPSSSRRWNGWTGSTIGGSWSRSATSRRPKPRNATTPCWNNLPWQRDSNQMASDQPGAVQWSITTKALSLASRSFLPFPLSCCGSKLANFGKKQEEQPNGKRRTPKFSNALILLRYHWELNPTSLKTALDTSESSVTLAW